MSDLLLDTNVIVWLLTGDRASVTSRALQALNDAERVLVSAASVWEIAIKRSLGKLELGSDWLVQLRGLDFAHLPIADVHAARVEHLPWHHRDPFDRLLVSQAEVEACDLVSADARLAQYGVRVVW